MGVGLDVVLGIHIQIPKTEIEMKITKTRMACVNPKCHNHKGLVNRYEHCPHCNSEIKNIETIKSKTDVFDWYDFAEFYGLDEGEFRWVEKENILFTNMSAISNNIDYEAVIEINEKYVEQKEKEFLKQHHETLSFIKQVVGSGVTLKFGLISQYM